jgi:hypothetical protein
MPKAETVDHLAVSGNNYSPAAHHDLPHHASKKNVLKNISSGEDAFWESVASHPGFLMQLDNL